MNITNLKVIRHSVTHFPTKVTNRLESVIAHTCRQIHTHTHRSSHLELLSLVERKASLAVLLTPAAFLVRVADHSILVSVGIEARVDVHRDLRLIRADIDCKAVARRNKKIA